MQTVTSVNTPLNLPTRFANNENVSRPKSMTSLELVDFINIRREAQAEKAGLPFPCGLYTRMVHHNFMVKVPKVLGSVSAPKFLGVDTFISGKGANSTRDIYILPKREACLMAMSYSYELQAAVFDHMTELEQELESRVLVTLPDFSNPAAAARAWAEQFELQQIASQALIDAAPKIAFVDSYVESTGLKGFRQTAKLLKANESRFREFLIDKRIMYRLGGEWQAYQPHIDAGRFDNKTGTSDSGHAFNQAKFTPKGVNWVAGLWAQHNLQGVE
ncbi:phage antirepressor KilAC domain-containing protein [Pseudomonas sp. CCI2.4]|uniref:phage antirepressor KilAC domain-containing protein n=1 Tax=Pseudomonas sp. CCI2.4 TaxID=3048617 RepID=UPI002B238B1F|nr:phage antirepressor KilAC domain-containing protein [Pseudomonas sp. CCI2.4]MEB0133393.1 phage antirepressor KilAC domain-containing protein [Pseudomonas sp. CCI2.4]